MDALVRSEVREVGFGFYTDDELRKLSSCKITSPIAQDSLGNCLTGGLYDARLGPCDQQFPCATCSLSYFGCPGHCGHIDLDVPVYHPMLFSSMFSLLKSKCMYCHKLRMSVAKVRLYLIKLKLLEMGDVASADTLDDFALPITLVDEKHPKEPADLEKRLRFYEERFATFAKKSGGTRRAGFHLKQLQKHVIDGFTKAAMAVKKCENCGAYSPAFRKDGHTKIFQKPFAKKVGKAMAALRFKSKSALEALRGDEENAAILADDSDAEAKEGGDSDEDDDDAKPSSADKYFVPMEVEAQIKLLWSYHADILDFIWGRSIRGGAPTEKPNKESWKLFFSRVVLVPPNRFRPLSKVGEGYAEHPQNVHLSKIIATNENIKRILVESSKDHVDGESRNEGGASSKNGEQKSSSDSGDEDENNPSGVVLDSGLSKVVSHWIELQDAVNCFMDSAKNPNPLGGQDVPGIRQLLERKEGLFRKHMMGKRVNYCCRSVISPDPYIGTNEVGIPVLFAKTLHYPTPVNHFNVKYLRKLVENGPHNYPGANQIEYADGKILKLEKLSAQERMAKANLLQKEKGAKVYRHLINGDVLLVNRQPTLHKPGVMAHKARVLTHVKEQTLRLSYANCNSYNADFDGDEMNCHFVQNDLARSEASFICNTDNQYIVPTSGNPLRGLIQDHVVSGVKLTCRNTFLSKAEFQQLLYIAVSGLPGTEVVASTERIVVPRPAILKPRPLWTGKQVVSSLIAHLCRAPLPSLHLDGKTRTPPTAYGAEQEEHVVVFRHGELLCGVIDKASVGNAAMGIVHAVYELYGGELAGRLLNAFGRLFTFYLQDAGHSCGIEDLTLTAKADEQRRTLLQKVGNDAEVGLKAFLAGDTVTDAVAASAGPISESQRRKSQFQLAEFMSTDRKEAKIRLDGAMQAVINKSASDVIKVCIPNGLDMPFTRNDFSMMVLTGAKGSAVNQSQISCFLGQQALEGMRVPIMISGKSLPSFRPYDTSARAGGFVQDRFLTGVKPQEYYFHCMAGREGLVDTAVKTSRSGYLQRCLVKHLEELKIAYDMTVRDSGGNIVQFLYGEDGLDPVNTGLLGGKPNQMLFLARNNQGFVYKYSLHGDFFTQSGLNLDEGMNHRLRLSQAKALLAQSRNTKDISRIVKKGNVVLARRKAISSLPWSIENLLHKWEVAEIVKVRDGKSDDGDRRVDLRYLDGTVEKKVPFSFQMTPRPSAGGGPENSFVRHLPVQLIKAGLPDPAMSHLRLDTAVGAISEKIQDAIVDYVHKNPDGAITSQTTDTSVSAESFELLMWVKYMRSLASPGEAVGCVAAQSIGEPSTQMTLNTFHLAGHGGANVTLGIPRLREILMTASKTPKTPTMLIPLATSEKMASAKFLARQLSRLSLGTLLKHKCGVEVREKLARGKVFRWERQYRIRFQFESPTAIAAAFGVTFEDILDTLRVKFRGKLVRLIRMEQRRAGEKATGRQDAVGQFGSKGGGDEVETRRGRLVGDNGEEREDDDGAADDGEKKGGKGKSWENDESSEDEDDDEEEDVDDEREQGTLRLGGKQEVSGYEDEDEDNKSEEGGNIMDVLNLGSSEEEESGSGDDDSEDSDDNKSGPGVVISKSAVTPTKARRNNRFDFDQSVAHNEADGWAEIQVTFPANSRRFLMVQLAEKAASDTLLRSTKNISNAYALQCEISGKDGVGVQTEGVNFEAIWSLPESQILFSELKSNDIWAVLQAYGVEAARSIIVAEILGVFGVYGIDVNPRHLSLIADFMTRTGSYLAMNRMGMNSCPSPFVQMSFETTCNFLTKAAQEGFIESQESPSARIVLGSVSKVGTGCFELMVPLQQTA